MNYLFLILIAIISMFPVKNYEYETIKAMTFNIRYGTANDGENAWDYRKDMVFQVICNSGCDFVGLQEAMIFQIEEIISQCPSYTYIGLTREADPTEGEASPVLYNKIKWELIEGETLWLSETPEKPGSRSWNSSLPRIFTWGKFKHRENDEELLIYNTHYDHMSAEARYNSSRILIEHIYSRINGLDIILLGDFNASENQAPIKYITTNQVQTLSDAYRTVNIQHSENDMTFYGWNDHKPGTGKRLDYIFFTGALIIESSEVVTFNIDGRYPSDHMPVIAEFR
jgi:endonuclease/exonuclease/phosphatase family metal-dependent hydrolase